MSPILPRLLAPILTLTVALGAASLAATPPAATPVVQGTTQRDGQSARNGQTFTIGKASPLNFTLLNAEYRAGRVVIGNDVITPGSGEKLLVLHYTVHNPQKADVRYYWADVRFTAIDLQNRPHEFVQAVAREGSTEALTVTLRPAQKVAVMTVIRVPAAGIMPKLVVQRDGDTSVLRYDLRGQVKALPAPYADPADASGASALAQPRFALGKAAPLGSLDVRLDAAQFTTGTLGGQVPAAGHRFLSVTLALTNPLSVSVPYSWSTYTPALRDADGETTAYNQVMLRASRDEAASGTLGGGETVRVRYFFDLPADVNADTVILSDRSGQRVAFDVSAAR